MASREIATSNINTYQIQCIGYAFLSVMLKSKTFREPRNEVRMIQFLVYIEGQVTARSTSVIIYSVNRKCFHCIIPLQRFTQTIRVFMEVLFPFCPIVCGMLDTVVDALCSVSDSALARPFDWSILKGLPIIVFLFFVHKPYYNRL